MHRFMKSFGISGVIFICALLLAACGVQFKPLPKPESEAVSQGPRLDPKVVYRFFDEGYTPGGYDYVYPDASRIYIPEESGHESEVSLQFDLIADDFSGGSVCLYNMLYDVRPYVSRGALQFWIKGNRGGEIAWAALVDDENRDGIKTVVRLPINNYGGIQSEWSLVQIPLADFGARGVFWDPKKQVEVPYEFDWEAVAEFRIEIKKHDNPKFRVWVDDIYIMRDTFDEKKIEKEEYWDEKEETLTSPPLAQAPQVKELHTLFENDVPAGGFLYVYGGKTTHKVQKTTDPGNPGVLALYHDNEDYSGVTLAMGQGRNLPLAGLRKTNAGLAFWAKAAPNVTKIYLGLLDDESDGIKVQTKLALGDFGKLDTAWKYFMVPLKQFQEQGKYWDEAKKAELVGDIQWDAINEIRFSVNRYENRVADGDPATLYVDRVAIIEDIPGYIDPEEYWRAFRSDKPDVLLHDMENEPEGAWEVASGEKSKVEASMVKPDAPNMGAKSLRIDYHLGDYADVMYDYKAQGSGSDIRNWSGHWGLRFSFYTERPYQPVTLQISDSGDELFVAGTGGVRGWNELLVPFKDFHKFPYYQPPGAEENGHFDLDNVVKIDFKPAGEGSKGWFLIDNVKLTNTREIEKPKAPEKAQVDVAADWEKTLTESINDGIFGINAALWDGDLLKPRTVEYVKAVNHKVLRYPGGLRADEDHWKEVLDRKDWMVDTDEFLEFCRQTGTEPMITVNFGRGTPEEAAAWVKHVNIDKKANVRYWEVGNELYGDWHPNFTTAEDYGKRSAEFIKAMKAIDPSILVTVVWVLEGDWNRVVFEHTKDLADGVNVHHYPQHAGEENDFALLAAPQTLDNIIPGVREQIAKWGNPDKKYEVWLTEWNSVDFKPGPQTLGIVNGLFLAEYLGKLAEHNIEQASYWDIHNDLTEEGGDYGYLSRTGAPDGDNVPRPSYWAFRLASEALRGRLAACGTSNDNVSCFSAERPDGSKAILLVNKLPETTAVVQISGLSGKAQLKLLTKDSGTDGYEKSEVDLSNALVLPPFSISVLSR